MAKPAGLQRCGSVGDILVAQGKADREEIEAAAADQGDQPIGLAIVRSEAASLTEVGRTLRKQRRMGGTEIAVESSVRVARTVWIAD